ncbi:MULTISPECIES: MFS transporter [unclassified Saccharothrix]|uniref:MFS transporter n=1 Tax=unclassified Saccharothrix TaxID=2593673 RepID=UPI00307DCECA
MTAVAIRPAVRPWPVLLTAAAGAVVAALDTTLVVVATPAIDADLGGVGREWVTTGYLLALTAALVPAGALSDRHGPRTAFLVGLVGFAVASVSAATASGIAALVAFRVAQGFFGALLHTSALGLVRAAFPVERVSNAVGVFTATIYVSTVVGPVVGGLAVEHAGWRAVFLLTLPIAAVAFAAGTRLPVGRASHRPAAGSLSDLRTPGFLAAVALTGVAGFTLIGTAFVLAVSLPDLGPLATGLRILPLTTGVIAGSVLCGPLVARSGARAVGVGSAVMAAVALIAVADDLGAQPVWPALLGVGLGGILVATATTAVTEAPPRVAGVAAGLRQCALNLGGALGTVVLGACLAGGAHRAVLTAAAVVAGGVLPSLLLKGRTR